MYYIIEEDNVLTVQRNPHKMSLSFLALIVFGLILLYSFSMSARIECQRHNSGTCIVYKRSGIGVMHEKDSFSLVEFSEARPTEAQVDLVLKNRTIRFSHGRISEREAIALASTINEFINTPDARTLREEQEPDFVRLVVGLLAALLGGIGFSLAGRKVWIRFDVGRDKITARGGFLRVRVQEFKVSDFDHAESWSTNESKKLAFIFRDGTVFHLEHYSTEEDLSAVVRAVDTFIQKHVTKPEFNSGW